MNIRKILGLKPKIGDKVEGYYDYNAKYEGIVIDEEKQLGGVWAKGEIKTSDALGNAIKLSYDRFFVLYSILRHK